VGSHVLDALQANCLQTAILIRNTTNPALIKRHLVQVDVRTGSINDPKSLSLAMEGITHVIHCAGCTKASHPSQYREINQNGTRKLVDAINAHHPSVQRLVHISSLAASGPATRESPAQEESLPNPISEYGRSKLAGETEVRTRCRAAFTILRPPAVYGPRETGFLAMFKAIRDHILPRASERQTLSLVFAKDLARAILACLNHPSAVGKTYFVSPRQIVTGRELAQLIARKMNTWTFPVPLPPAVLWPICLYQELSSRLTGKATLLNLQKFAELRAPGWVCDPSRLERELGFACSTTLDQGVPETISWYQQENWL